MPLTIQTLEETEAMGKYTVKERLYYTEGRDRVVPEGDPNAAFLFAPKGRQILEAEAARLGLLDDEAAPAESVDTPAEPTPAAAPEPGDEAAVRSVTAEPADEATDTPSEPPAEGHVCPDCGKVCKTKSGLGAHRRAKHAT